MFFKVYLMCWISLCIVAVLFMRVNRSSLEIFNKEYWRLLLQKWKLNSFIAALLGITLIAPYTGDPTWDYVDAIFMSFLAYATSPWVVGTLYRFFRCRLSWEKIFIAVCVWLFSVSWSYDAYLLVRDGMYPITWFSNLMASSILYCCAGLFWSLEWTPVRGVHFNFTESNWPYTPAGECFKQVVWYGLPFALLVCAALGSLLI